MTARAVQWTISFSGDGMVARGIVITPRFTFDGHKFSLQGGFDPVSLRQYLLYWDKIDWPDNNVISISGSNSEIDFLQTVGVLERTKIRFSGTCRNAGYAMLGMQMVALERRNKKDPGAWSLAQQSELLVGPTEGTIEAHTIEIELYSALPVPSANVSLEEVLEFKLKRSDELLRFRAAMDGLYLQVAGAADIPRAKLQTMDELQAALQELNAVFGESFARRLLASIKVELNLPDFILKAVAGATSAATFGMPIAIGAAAGAIAASLKFDLTRIRKSRQIPDRLRDYAYLHHIVKELG